jgi:hypothetical protein
VTANYGNHTVSVLQGNGDGTFGPQCISTSASRPYDVLAVDLDGDGRIDLVTANYTSGNVSVLLNRREAVGELAFGRTDYATGSGPMAVTAADLDGDGVLDLAVANYSSHTVSVLPGNGDGSFCAKMDWATLSHPRAIVAADLDGDGRADLATAHHLSGNNIAVLLNTSQAPGSFAFGPRGDYAAGASSLYDLLAVDLDGDGTADLVAASYGSNRVVVLAGRGDGTWDAPAVYPVERQSDRRDGGRLQPRWAGGHRFGQLRQPLGDAADRQRHAAAGRGSGRQRVAAWLWPWQPVGRRPGCGLLVVHGPSRRAVVGGGGDSRKPLFERVVLRDLPAGRATLTSFYCQFARLGPVDAGSASHRRHVPGAGQPILGLRGRVPFARDHGGSAAADGAGGQRQHLHRQHAALAVSGPHQQATVVGYVGLGDPGDFYLLGNLTGGTTITLGLASRRPAA